MCSCVMWAQSDVAAALLLLCRAVGDDLVPPGACGPPCEHAFSTESGTFVPCSDPCNDNRCRLASTIREVLNYSLGVLAEPRLSSHRTVAPQLLATFVVAEDPLWADAVGWGALPES
jgi:hypothetical protein